MLQARILVWVAILSSRGSSWSRDRNPISYVSCIGRTVLYQEHHLGSGWIFQSEWRFSPKLKPVWAWLPFSGGSSVTLISLDMPKSQEWTWPGLTLVLRTHIHTPLFRQLFIFFFLWQCLWAHLKQISCKSCVWGGRLWRGEFIL